MSPMSIGSTTCLWLEVAVTEVEQKLDIGRHAIGKIRENCRE